MPVKVVQSEVTPPFPVNSKQVSRYQITCRLTTTRLKLYSTAWCEPHAAVQWVSVHGSPEVQRQPVRRGGDAAGEPRPAQHRAHQLVLQHVDEENAYLCGYLKIKNLTDEYPEMVTFFDGELISDKHPFLTRKWDADEDVDKKHWVGTLAMITPDSAAVWWPAHVCV